MLSYKKNKHMDSLLQGHSHLCNEMLKIIGFLTYRCFIYIIHGCPGFGGFFVKLSVNSSQVIQH